MPVVRLFETQRRHGLYTALSHCWGPPEKRPLRTIRDNLGSHLQDIPYESLPATFQDAVAVTRKLGLQYLWIDSLCIVQDDEDDWRIESAKMGDIYEKATLTIGASGATDSTEGLFMPILAKPGPVAMPYMPNGFDEVAQGCLMMHQSSDCLSSFCKLRKRAWCVQERLLSRRMVSFKKGGLSWKCRRSSFDELGLPLLEEVFPEWHRLLRDYSKCQLTHSSDRLVALEGLANRMKRSKHDQYHYGVWTDELVENLLWSRWTTRRSDEDLPELPSWSWASKSGVKSFWACSWLPSYSWETTMGAIAIKDPGVLSITNACGMPCMATKERATHGMGREVEEAKIWMRWPTDRAVTYIRCLSGNAQELVGIAVLDDPSSQPTCCVTLVRLIQPTGEDWHFVLLLRPTTQGVHRFERIGMGIVPHSYWDGNDVRYPYVDVV